MAIFSLCYDSSAARFISKLIDSAQLAWGAVTSGKVASGNIADAHIVSGLDANKLHSGYFGFKVGSGYSVEGLTGLIPPARISGLPYTNLASGISQDILLSGYLGYKVASGYPAVGLTGYLSFARLSGLPFANLNTEIQSFTNLLANGSFEVGDPPSGWTLYGYGVSTFVRSSEQKRNGSYSAKLTNDATHTCVVAQAIAEFVYYRGRKVTQGCWVYATVAGKAYLNFWDGFGGGTNSSYHTGVAGWEWLTVTVTVNVAATTVRCGLSLDATDPVTSAYFDGAILVEGDSCPAFSPIPVDIESVTSGKIASGNVGDKHVVDLAATKLTGLIPPARISGLPYGNLYLTNSIVDGDIVGLAATKLTGLVPYASVSGLLPLAGGTLTGDLAVQKDNPLIGIKNLVGTYVGYMASTSGAHGLFVNTPTVTEKLLLLQAGAVTRWSVDLDGTLSVGTIPNARLIDNDVTNVKLKSTTRSALIATLLSTESSTTVRLEDVDEYAFLPFVLTDKVTTSPTGGIYWDIAISIALANTAYRYIGYWVSHTTGIATTYFYGGYRYLISSRPPEIWLCFNKEMELIYLDCCGSGLEFSPPFTYTEEMAFIAQLPITENQYRKLEERSWGSCMAAYVHQGIKIEGKKATIDEFEFPLEIKAKADVPRLRRVPKIQPVEFFNEITGQWETRQESIYETIPAKRFQLQYPLSGKISPITERLVEEQRPVMKSIQVS